MIDNWNNIIDLGSLNPPYYINRGFKILYIKSGYFTTRFEFTPH
jgi:hypothetical protein